jgi:hypothetical protein
MKAWEIDGAGERKQEIADKALKITNDKRRAEAVACLPVGIGSR